MINFTGKSIDTLWGQSYVIICPSTRVTVTLISHYTVNFHAVKTATSNHCISYSLDSSIPKSTFQLLLLLLLGCQ